MRFNLILVLFLICLISNVSGTSFSYTNASGDSPLLVTFTDTTDPVPDSFFWSFGDGSSSTEQNPSHVYLSTGQYNVQFLTTKGGVTSGSLIDGAVSVNYGYGTTTGNYTYVITGINDVQFYDHSICVPTCSQWSWDFDNDGNSESTLKNPRYIYPDNGTYTAVLTVGSNATSGAESKIITIGSRIYPTIPVPSENPNQVMFTLPQSSQDIGNSSYLKMWIPELIKKNGTFNVMAFAASIMAPTMHVFGFWIYLIIWGLYIFAVWIRTQDVTMPLIIGILSMAIFGVLFPTESLPVIIIMFVVCGAIIITKLMKDSI